MNVEVSNLSTVSNQVADGVQSISLDNSGEGDHLTLSTRMPDHTLDKTLSRGSAGVEVNLSGGVGQLHRVCCVDELSIGQSGGRVRAEWTLLEVALGGVQFVGPLCDSIVTLLIVYEVRTKLVEEVKRIVDAVLRDGEVLLNFGHGPLNTLVL